MCWMSGDDNPTPPQKTPEQLAEEQAAKDSAARDATLAKTQPTLDQYLTPPGGDPTKSPFYGALLRTGRSATAKSYETARSASRMKANAAGFGYQQPIVQGNDTALEASEASDMAALPDKALLESTQPALQSVALETGQAGLYNPNAALGNAVSASNNAANNKTALYLALLNAGNQAATYAPMIWS
jgi:hypothetical protein